jgi:hypothetical protein
MTTDEINELAILELLESNHNRYFSPQDIKDKLKDDISIESVEIFIIDQFANKNNKGVDNDGNGNYRINSSGRVLRRILRDKRQLENSINWQARFQWAWNVVTLIVAIAAVIVAFIGYKSGDKTKYLKRELLAKDTLITKLRQDTVSLMNQIDLLKAQGQSDKEMISTLTDSLSTTKHD